MSSGRKGSRLVFALGATVAGVIVTACADKAFHPPLNGSPKIQLQFGTVGAQQVNASGKKQVLLVAAGYQSTPVGTDNKDGFRQLAGAIVQITGGSQTVTLNVDLTGCLADGTRKGSSTACSIYYGVALHDSAEFLSDSGDFNKLAYDYRIVGPIDVVPGKTPVLPAITLSQTAFEVFRFTGDEALRLGGIQTPQNFSGPITGTVAGLAPGNPAVLFALTQGTQQTSTCASNQSNCTPTFNFGAQLAIFQNNTWKRVNGPQGINQFNDVAAFAVNDVYLAGQNGIYHYDGNAISVVSGTTGENVVSISAVVSGGNKYVVAGTSGGNAWFGNTTTWTKSQVSITGGGIDAVCVTGPNEGFAANSSSGALFRFNGTSWTTAPSSFVGSKPDLQCPAPGQAFVGFNSSTYVGVLNWNGSSFIGLNPTPRFGRLAAVSSSEMYLAADSGGSNRKFYKYNGSSWTLVGTSQFVQPMFARPWADPRGGAAYFQSSFGRVDQATPSGAHPISYNPSIRDAIMTSANSAFVVGWNMFLARWNGITWTVDQPPSGTISFRILAGVWSDGPSNAWTVGNSSTILHWDGSSWSTLSDQLRPIAGFDNYNAVWGAAGHVWIAGGNSILHCRTLTSCSPDPVSGIDTLYGIWASSATNGWAVGSRGKILHYDGTSWTAATSPTTHRMVRVQGSGASDVWAVGDSVILHFDGTAWTEKVNSDAISSNTTNAPPTGSQFAPGLGVWIAGPREFYLGNFNGSIYRYDASQSVGNQWTGMPTPNQNGGGSGRIVAISGYAGGCGIALVDMQTSFNSSTLLRGVGPTGCLGSSMPVALPWP